MGSASQGGVSGADVRYRRSSLLLALVPSLGGGDIERFPICGELCGVIATRWSLPVPERLAEAPSQQDHGRLSLVLDPVLCRLLTRNRVENIAQIRDI